MVFSIPCDRLCACNYDHCVSVERGAESDDLDRLEPWIVNVVNAVVMWGVNAVRGVVRKLIDYFLA